MRKILKKAALLLIALCSIVSISVFSATPQSFAANDKEKTETPTASDQATLESCEYLKPTDSSGNWTAYENCRKTVGEDTEESTSAEKCSLLPEEAREAAGCNRNKDLLGTVIYNILISVIFFSGLISVVFIVIGGIKYTTSQGDTTKLQEGKKTLLFASVGLVVTSLAFAIINFTINTIYEEPPEEPGPCDYMKPDGSGGGNWTAYNECMKSIDDTEETPTSTFLKKDPCKYLYPTENGGNWTAYNECRKSVNSSYSGIGAGDEVTNVTLLNHKQVYVGDEQKLIAHITPSWLASKSPITWSSDNPSVVSVDKVGRINAKGVGTAKITAKANNNVTASTKITVVAPIEPENVTIEQKNAKVSRGKQVSLTATVSPVNATNKHINWSTDNAAVATVNNRGQVTGKKAGTANIFAKTMNGKSTSIPVTVTDDGGSGTIKITPALLKELDYFYQTSHHEPISGNCGNDAGSVTCGPASYMASVYLLTKQKVNYQQFAQEACGRWLGSSGSGVDGLVTVYAEEYRAKYHVKISRLPNTWDAAVSELKKGHPVIFLVHSIDPGVAASQGYRLTNGKHYVLAISYRNQDGGQMYIWSPVSEKAVPGRNIGDCSEGQCWYDKAAFQRNINEAAWTLQKI